MFKIKFRLVFMSMFAALIAATLVLSLSVTSRADKLEINETNYPDPNFRTFVLNLFGGNTYPTSSNYDRVTEMDISNRNITDLTGIENFYSLKKLKCSGNPINSLSFSDCFLEELDVSNCSSLETLYLMNISLGSLDLTGCSSLKTLYAINTSLDELKALDCTNLEYLSCGNNPSLSALDLHGLKKLRTLYCAGSNLQSLNIDGCTGLEVVNCYMTSLKVLVLTDNPSLKKLDCRNNDLTIFDVSMCTGLTLVQIQDNTNLAKAYIPDNGCGIGYTPETTTIFRLSPSDWEVEECIWKGDDENGYTKVTVIFLCTKEGVKNHRDSVELDVLSEVINPSCTEDGAIRYYAPLKADDSRCKEDQIFEWIVKTSSKTGHSWSGWTVTKAATVAAEGEKTRTCSLCGQSEKQTIAKLTPTPTEKPAADPTTSPSKDPDVTPTKAPAGSIMIDKKTDNVLCGKTTVLKITGNNTSKVTWKSSDSKVATVDSSGKVTAKMAGTATITATVSGQSATCTLTVLYKDVTNAKDFWYAPTNYLTGKGVVKGYANQTEFRPANVCTRAQMVTFIWRLQGEPKPKAAKCKFSDVKKSDYFYKACIWGNENHIVEGYKDGTFGPQIVCARKHAVTFLWRLANKPKPASGKNKFKDVKKNDYFYTATLWASEKGILAGYSDGTFRPNGNCLRRQMVTFLYKYDKFINNK